MANIVALGLGEKGRVLLAQWRNKGGHTTSEDSAEVGAADVVLIDIDAIEGGFDGIAPQLAGKVVIDCSNITDVAGLQSGASNATDIARRCPDAHVAKALNTIDPSALTAVFDRGTPSNGAYMSAFFCTDDAQARQMVAGLLDEIDLDPVDCGPLANATLLDGIGVLERYLAKNVFKPPFAIVVSREPVDRSPLDRWM